VVKYFYHPAESDCKNFCAVFFYPVYRESTVFGFIITARRRLKISLLRSRRAVAALWDTVTTVFKLCFTVLPSGATFREQWLLTHLRWGILTGFVFGFALALLLAQLL
jgi:hypothetical protein